MAAIADIFSHSTPQVFYNEAPPNSSNIGEQGVVTRVFDAVDAIIRARYGTGAAIPNGHADTSAANVAVLTAQQRAAAGSGNGIWLLLIAVVVIFLISRR